MDYEQISTYLRDKLYDLGIYPQYVVFDRWSITHFKKAAQDVGFLQDATWIECGQGYKDMSPRCKNFETLILLEKVRHGSHPLLNLAFSNAMSVMDPAGSIKLDKSKSTQRIDAAIACVMSAFQVSEGNTETEFDPLAMIA